MKVVISSSDIMELFGSSMAKMFQDKAEILLPKDRAYKMLEEMGITKDGIKNTLKKFQKEMGTSHEKGSNFIASD